MVQLGSNDTQGEECVLFLQGQQGSHDSMGNIVIKHTNGKLYPQTPSSGASPLH